MSDDLKIHNGIRVGDEVAFGLFDMGSESVDDDSAILACMTTCYIRLVLNGWSKDLLDQNIQDAYQAACDIYEKMEAAE